MSKVATGVYRVTVTLKSSHAGTLRLRVHGSDDDGGSQASNLYLPLHWVAQPAPSGPTVPHRTALTPPYRVRTGTSGLGRDLRHGGLR